MNLRYNMKKKKPGLKLTKLKLLVFFLLVFFWIQKLGNATKYFILKLCLLNLLSLIQILFFIVSK